MGAGSVLAAGSLASFLQSCSKNAGMGNAAAAMPAANGFSEKSLSVIEGSFTTPLAFPKVAGNSGTLYAQQTLAAIKSKTVKVWGYQPNNMLGPTIRVKRGTTINYILQNSLSEPTNVHWHGLNVPQSMDGYPTDLVAAGSSFNYQFQVKQRAGLNWYHPHPDKNTGKQVFMGLAGLFIVNDAEEAALSLPAGAYEMPLVISDKNISSSSIVYNPGMMDIMYGYFGNTVTVNGICSPIAQVATHYYRLRVLNGSNARIYNLALSNNADMVIIGNDGGLLKNPVTVNTILLAPAERLDILINFEGQPLGTELFLQSRTFTGASAAQGTQAFNIMKFKVAKSVTGNYVVPAVLSSIVELSESSAVATRNFDISNSGMMMMQHTINGKAFNASRIDAAPAANTNEIWVFDNSKGSDPHPMHIHGVKFQVLYRAGGRAALAPHETGWKDTILVLPKEKVRVIVPFGTATGKFVFHCHNLEHEDDGMMAQYQLS